MLVGVACLLAHGPALHHAWAHQLSRQPPSMIITDPPACQPCCRQVFLYLDRAYVVSNPGTLSVFQLGLRQLRCQFEALPHVSL